MWKGLVAHMYYAAILHLFCLCVKRCILTVIKYVTCCLYPNVCIHRLSKEYSPLPFCEASETPLYQPSWQLWVDCVQPPPCTLLKTWLPKSYQLCLLYSLTQIKRSEKRLVNLVIILSHAMFLLVLFFEWQFLW